MEKEIICGIYKITSPSGKVYIGESEDIKTRKYYYKIKSCKKQRRLYNSLVKYGWEAHVFEIIEECDFEELLCRERHWQDFYDVLGKNGLNLKLTQCGEQKVIMSQETKDKIGLGNSGSNNGMYGKKHSEESKQNRRDYRHTPESIALIQKHSTRGNNPKAKLVYSLWKWSEIK